MTAGDADDGAEMPRARPEGRGPRPALQRGPLAHDRARPDLGHATPVHLDDEHPVEDEVDLGSTASPTLGLNYNSMPMKARH